jgi:HEAT repeat protein
MNYRLVCCMTAIIAISIIGCSPCGRYMSSLKNDDVAKRRDAAYQLYKLDNIKKEMVPDLLLATEDSDPVVREYTLKAIGKLPPRTPGIAKVLRICLRDSNVVVRRTAAAIFSRMDPAPSEILVPLAEALGDNDSLLYTYVKSTFIDLGRLGVTVLVNSCKSPNDHLRCRAASTLGTIGCDAKRALPTLQAMLNDQNDSVRTAAKTSIEKIQLSYSCNSQTTRKMQ